MEGALLGCFLFSACVCAAILEHPDSYCRRRIGSPVARRALMGLAMGLTAVGLIYSAWGQQSGAHMNPATTLTFLILGKLTPWDAMFYVIAQFAGAVGGVAISGLCLGEWVRHESIRHVVTVPGRLGAVVAWWAELAISFGMMLVVLIASNRADLSAFTGLFAGALVAIYILFESPLSGMSMNPARSFGSALVAREWRAFWIYLTAPPIGMLLACAAFRAASPDSRVYCAKLQHADNRPCIFNCEYEQISPRVPAR